MNSLWIKEEYIYYWNTQSINYYFAPKHVLADWICQVKTSRYLVYDFSAYLNLYFWILDQFKISRF